MCDTYDLDLNSREIAGLLEKLTATTRDRIKSRIVPEAPAPVLIEGMAVKAMDWGYPRWNGGGVIFNARGETAAEKNTFGKSLRERRCVIPTSGFYEFQTHEGHSPKPLYFFRSPRQQATWIAGIWQDHDGTDVFTMLTAPAGTGTEADPDRIPIVLSTEEREGWLNGPLLDDVLYRPPPELTAAPAS